MTTLGYDGLGRQTTVTNHEGYVTTTAYDKLDRVTSVTGADPDGAGSLTAPVTSYGYDIWNHVTSTTDPKGGNTYFTFDAAGQIITLKDPVNNITTWAYDNLGHVTMETNQLGHTRSFTHDAAGNLTRKADRNSRLTQYEFDELNRLTAEKWLTGSTPPTIALATTTEGGPVNEVQRVGYTVTMNAYGGQFTLTFSGQTTSGIAYNATAATVQSALEALSNIGVGDVVVTKLQNTGTAQEWKVTFQGALAGTDQSQITINTASVSYMGTKTNIQATDTAGGSSTPDEVQTVTLSNATAGTFRLGFSGQTTGAIAYNASASTVESVLENLQAIDNVTVTGSAGGPWTVTFVGAQAGTNVTTLQGDAATTQSGSVSRTISTVYDVASQVTSTSDADSAYAYTFDNMGRVLTVSNSGTSGIPTVVLTSAYNAASNRTSLSATVGGTADFKNDYSFDNLNRMTRVEQIGQSGGNTVAKKGATLNYNALGQFTSIVREVKPSSTWNEVATTAFTYDTLNRVTGMDHKKAGTNLFTGSSWTYDRINRVTQATTQDGTADYTYDASSRLTAVDYSYQADETFGYDANGNRNSSGYTVSSNNRVTADGTYTYTFDNEGNVTRRTKTSDGSYRDYVWDYRNRLTQILEKNSGGTIQKQSDYTYDVFNLRIKKSVDNDGPGSGAAVVGSTVYDGDAVVLSYDGSSALTHRYLSALDQIFGDEDALGAVLVPLSDRDGSLTDLVNSSGTSQNHLTYSSFGKVMSETNASVDFICGYGGMERDEESAQWYTDGNYVNSLTGTFISQTPALGGATTPNPYTYGLNSPTNFVQPGGSMPLPLGGVPVSTMSMAEDAEWRRQYMMQSMPAVTPVPQGGDEPVDNIMSRPGGMGSILSDLAKDSPADKALNDQRNEQYKYGLKAAEEGQRTLAGFNPLGIAIDVGEAVSGKNLLDREGTKLTTAQRAQSAAMAALSLVPGGIADDAAKNGKRLARAKQVGTATEGFFERLRGIIRTITGRTAAGGTTPVSVIEGMGDALQNAPSNVAGHRTFKPGPHSAGSIPAKSTAQTFTEAERAAVDAIGYNTGCHTCGTKTPGTKSGHFVPDHQPPTRLNDDNLPQELFPHCIDCSREQGLAIARKQRQQ